MNVPGVESALADFCNQAMIGAGLANTTIPGGPITGPAPTSMAC